MAPPVIHLPTFNDLLDSTGADFVADLVSTFAEEAPGMLAELQAAWVAASPDRFRRAAHSLKSNALSFGAQRLADCARSLERDGLPADDAPLAALQARYLEAAAELAALARG